jgi:hypothetical protein
MLSVADMPFCQFELDSNRFQECKHEKIMVPSTNKIPNYAHAESHSFEDVGENHDLCLYGEVPSGVLARQISEIDEDMDAVRISVMHIKSRIEEEAAAPRALGEKILHSLTLVERTLGADACSEMCQHVIKDTVGCTEIDKNTWDGLSRLMLRNGHPATDERRGASRAAMHLEDNVAIAARRSAAPQVAATQLPRGPLSTTPGACSGTAPQMQLGTLWQSTVGAPSSHPMCGSPVIYHGDALAVNKMPSRIKPPAAPMSYMGQPAPEKGAYASPPPPGLIEPVGWPSPSQFQKQQQHHQLVHQQQLHFHQQRQNRQEALAAMSHGYNVGMQPYAMGVEDDGADDSELDYMPMTHASAEAGWEGGVTTVLVHNVPARFTCDSLAEICASKGECNFLHLPRSSRAMAPSGLAIINFFTAAQATAFYKRWHGMKLPNHGRKSGALKVKPAHIQGLLPNLSQIARRKGISNLRGHSMFPAVFDKAGNRLSWREVCAQHAIQQWV